jgi:hypothetical protein
VIGLRLFEDLLIIQTNFVVHMRHCTEITQLEREVLGPYGSVDFTVLLSKNLPVIPIFFYINTQREGKINLLKI